MAGRGPGSRAGTPCTDHTGTKFKSMSEMARAWGLTTCTLTGRLRRGMELEQALTAPIMHGPEQPCTDHTGTQWRSLAEMIRYYGISMSLWKYRHLQRRWDLRDTLETPVGDPDLAGAHACTDHLGNRFPSIKAMCDHWHVPRNVFFSRRKAGKTLAQCLDPETRVRKSQARDITDHTGKNYRNLDAMCAAWNISKAQYMQNIRNGLGIADALTQATPRPRHPKDHTGTEYPSINAMCKAWGVTKTTLRARLELGWTLREVLEHPGNESNYAEAVDHLGNKYRCLRDMLKAYNVTYATYKHRLAHGASLEQALSPHDLHHVRCSDHLGNQFPCLQAMLEYWHVHAGCYHARTVRGGMPLQQALTARYIRRSPQCGVEIPSKHGAFFLCRYQGRSYMLSQEGVHALLCRAALNQYMADGTGAMSCREIQHGWYRIEGGAAGPGAIMNAQGAWRMAVLSKYLPKPKITLMGKDERRRYEAAMNSK